MYSWRTGAKEAGGGDPLWLLGLPRGALVAEKEEEEDGPKEKVGGGKVIWDGIKGRRLPYVRTGDVKSSQESGFYTYKARFVPLSIQK